MASVALLILLRGLAQLVWGAETRPFPAILPSGAWTIGPFIVTKRLLIGAVMTVALVELLHWFFMRTRQGMRLAAVAEDHYTALSMGISVRQAIAVAWIMGAVARRASARWFCCRARSCRSSAASIGLQGAAGRASRRHGIGARRAAGGRAHRHRRGRRLGLRSTRSPTASRSRLLPFAIMICVLLIRPQGLFGWKVIERL